MSNPAPQRSQEKSIPDGAISHSLSPYDDVEALFVACRRMEAALRREQTQVRSIQQELEKEKQSRDSGLLEYKRKNQELAARLEAVRAELDHAKILHHQDLKKGDEENQQLRVQLASEKDLYRQEIEALKNQLTQELRKSDLEVARWRSTAEAEKDRQGALLDEIKRAHDSKEEYQNRIKLHEEELSKWAEGLKAELEARASQIAKLQGNVDKLKGELYEKRTDVNLLKAQLKDSESHLLTYKSAYSDITVRESRLRAHIENLTRELNELRQSFKQSEKARFEAEKLIHQLK